MITVTVYHNTGPDHFFGFNELSPAELVAVHGFNLPGADDPMTDLNYIWEQLNIDQPTEAWAKRYRLKRLRSLSVGDVVTIGEVAWAVGSYGWDRITTHELVSAISG